MAQGSSLRRTAPFDTTNTKSRSRPSWEFVPAAKKQDQALTPPIGEMSRGSAFPYPREIDRHCQNAPVVMRPEVTRRFARTQDGQTHLRARLQPAA